jgi:hypothetical protein
MKAIASVAMMLVVYGGFLWVRGTSSEKTPSREFAELELAGADADHTGSCYSLSTVLVANGIFGKAPRTWIPGSNQNLWTLSLESIQQGYAGPVHDYQKYTFEKMGEQVRLVSVDVAKGRPADLKSNIDDLLNSPNALGSTPVDRCLKEGGTGYLYQPGKQR